MDIQFQSNGRNGVEGEFFNFAVLPALVPGLIIKNVINKGKAKKYKTAELQSLKADFPWGETTAEQDKIIIKLKAAKDVKQRELSVAKNKTQKRFRQSELDAIVAYISDATAYRKELSAAEKQEALAAKGGGIVGNNTMEAPQVEVVKLTSPEKLAQQEAVTAASTSGGSNKLLIFGGIGIGALILILILTKKK